MVIVNADRIENPVYRNFKKIPFTENVTGPWRAGINKRYNLVIKAQVPHASTGATTV
jgi:hypothetical protein